MNLSRFFIMSGTHTAAKQQPPSPPHSNDGDFDLSAIQQHIDSVDPQSVHPHIRPTPLVEQFIVSEAAS